MVCTDIHDVVETFLTGAYLGQRQEFLCFTGERVMI